MTRKSALLPFVALALANCPAWSAVPADVAKAATVAEFDSAVSSTSDASLKSVLIEHRPAILAAMEQRPHAEAVARIVEGARGEVEKINTTPEMLKKAAGGDLPQFETLKLVDLAVPNAGPHDKRTNDPYDAAFFEHLGHIPSLESLNIISTKLNDEWIASIAKLTNLKTLRFTNNGKLTDSGLEKLAGLKSMETFSFVGTGMKGHAFAKFDGWTRLVKCSFRGSSIDDEGLLRLCEHFPNLESISLAHAKFSDAGAPHLAKLKKLKSLELGTQNATPASLTHLANLPLEYLQLGEGFDSPQSLTIIKDIPTLKRLTLNNCAKTTEADLQTLASMKQLESLELGNLPMTEERIPLLKAFAHLKSLRLVQRPQPYPDAVQTGIAGLLPKVQLTFK